MILKQTQAETMKAQLSDLLISISWADLAKRYFNRSGSWLYHKLDGIDGNKKPTPDFVIAYPKILRQRVLLFSDVLPSALFGYKPPCSKVA